MCETLRMETPAPGVEVASGPKAGPEAVENAVTVVSLTPFVPI